MKRLRDDDDAYVNSQIKRPLVSPIAESYAQPQISGVGGRVETHKLTADDALSYLKAVKAMFQDQKEKYNMFLDVMKDFKSQRIDTSGVIARVKILFKGHNELIFGFNTFLPKDCEIKVADDEETPPKKRDVDFVEAISFVNKIKKRFQNDDRVYKSFLYTLNMYRQDNKDITEVNHEVEELFNEHPDLLEEFKRFLPNAAVASTTHVSTTVRNSVPSDDEVAATHVDKHQSRHQEMPKTAPKIEHGPIAERPEPVNDGGKEKLDIKESEDNNKAGETNNVHHQSRLLERRKSPRKVDSSGVNSVSPSVHEKDALKSTFNQEFSFCEKVKERLQNPADYQAFLKCLNIYSTEVITKKELQSLVNDLLGKYPDLMDGFNKFFEQCESIDGLLAGIMSKKPLPMEVEESKSKEQKPKEKDRSKGKYSGKSIQELDLSDCERCTPSYRLLPEDYPIPSVSQRTELGAQLLNDRWVSVTSGSEDYSFTHMRRNQYEESLFRCEDDRFELDMLLESVRSTIKCVENLLNGIVDNATSSTSPIRIEDHFTAQHLRCIERIYGDHGLEMMELLRKNPSATLSVILTRLKNKKEEWTKCLSDFNRVWASVYARNHNKSLDHRSFYFKLEDSENMNTTSLVAEIKEHKEKKQDLVFEYCNNGVHEDMSNIIEFSCKELCTSKDQLNKVKRIWTCLIQPMVGVVPPQHRNSEGTGYLNGFESTSADRPESSRGNFVNGGKENGFMLEKEMRNTSLSDQARPGTASLQHCEVVRSVPLVNGTAYHENHKIEKEEGELSPNGDFEDETFPQEARFENHKEKSSIPTSNCASSKQKDTLVLYGNDTFYVLFRLHQILYERLLSAKSSPTYGRFMSALYSLLDGTCDNTQFEFDCQDIIGKHSYTLFTLDRLIYKLVKKLQAIASDDLDNKLLQFYEYQNVRKPEKYVDAVYYQSVHALLHDKNIYQLECSFGPPRLSFQLINDINQETDPTATESSLCA